MATQTMNKAASFFIALFPKVLRDRFQLKARVCAALSVQIQLKMLSDYTQNHGKNGY